MNKSEHKLSKLKAGKTRLFQTIDFTWLEHCNKLTDAKNTSCDNYKLYITSFPNN